MKRREFITLLGGAAAAWPLAARAQQGERMRRIGVLMTLAADDAKDRHATGHSCRACSNWAGPTARNVQIDSRWAAGDAGRIQRYAAELLALAPDVIVASAAPSVASTAAGNPHRANRVRERPRSGRCRLCR